MTVLDLMAALAEDPDDMVTRAMYADWLEEAGDAEAVQRERGILRFSEIHGERWQYIGNGGWVMRQGPGAVIHWEDIKDESH